MLLYCLRQYQTQITGEKESKEVHGFENYEQKGKRKNDVIFLKQNWILPYRICTTPHVQISNHQYDMCFCTFFQDILP